MSTGTVIALLLSGGLVLFALLNYVRGGTWNAKTELQTLTKTLTSHDERLKTVEQRIGEMPTASAVTEIKHAVDRLDISLAGKLENVSLRLTQGERERAAQAHQSEKERADLAVSIKRVENFLIDQAKETARTS